MVKIQQCPLGIVVSVLLMAGFGQHAAKAQPCPPSDEVFKVTASDGATNDLFGESVAIDGDRMIIGAPGDDDNGLSSGAAYIVDATTGQEIFKLIASDGEPSDGFGSSVAIDGSLAIVGAPGNDVGQMTGAAYVFDVTTGQELLKLNASDAAANDGFGQAVAMDGNLAIIGAPGDDDNGSGSGSAYLFDVSTGQQLFKLTASDGAKRDSFGSGAAISRNLAIVGASGYSRSAPGAGAAYVFDVNTGQQLLKLTAPDPAEADRFGEDVAMDGNLAIIGVRQDDDNGPDSGSAYLFDVFTGQRLFKLIAPDGEPGDWFGASVAIEGDLAIVGANADDDRGGQNSGSAYVFDVNTGNELVKLTASDGAANSQFGASVSFRGNAAVIGARTDDSHGSASGSAYLFRSTPTLTVAPLPLEGGSPAAFSVCGLRPNKRTWVLYSISGTGIRYLNKLNVFINLDEPVVAHQSLADENGTFIWTPIIPNTGSSFPVWLQVVQRSVVTNYVATQVMP